MDKQTLITELTDAVERLYEDVHQAGIVSSVAEGRYPHEIAHGLDIPMGVAALYLRQIKNILNNPESKKDYSILHPIKRARANRAAQDAAAVLDSLPLDTLQEAHEAAKEALDGKLAEGILHYANALTNRSGQTMTPEDQQIMHPVIKAMEFLQAVLNLRMQPSGGAYQPDV